MEFFRNLTAVNLVKPEERPTSGSATAVNIPTNTSPTTGFEKPTPISGIAVIGGININKPPVEIPVEPPIEKRIEEPIYGGGGGGFSFGEEEVVPTEVVEKKSNVGKTMLILAAVGLGLWLLSGGKKVKVK